VVGLEFLVGTSFAATELLQLHTTFGLLHSHRRLFGFARDSNCTIAGLRKILSCAIYIIRLALGRFHDHCTDADWQAKKKQVLISVL